jgi:hypothetical protein
MKPFESADIVFIEMLKARHESLKAQLAAAERVPQDARHAAEIAAELREMIDKATAEFFRIADRLAALTEEASRALCAWRPRPSQNHADPVASVWDAVAATASRL